MQDDFNLSAINYTKGAITYANFVTTVSPQHAWEARHTDQGFGLGHCLHRHQNKFGGILNGLDYEVWNPTIDPLIPHPYTADRIEEKYRNKKALRDRLLLRDEYKPIIAYVGRLDTQKGVHLIRHGLFYSLWNGAQFVLLGSSPECGINDYFWHLKGYLNESPDCHLEIGYNEELAHLIYAGSDMILVPSLYEPCGLTQLIGLRYGTVPVVRGVGGLLDTVFDRDHSTKAPEDRNGFVFYQADYPAVESALLRSIRLWYDAPHDYRSLIRNGMRHDWSWNHSGRNYVNVYEHIRHK
jgi:starch synthase